MKRILKSTIAFVIAFMFAVTGAFMFNGIGSPVYADVGSVADDEDVSYDKNGGILNSIGIDASKMPEDYDQNATGNPYGSDTTNLNAVHELLMIHSYMNQATLYGHNANLDSKYETLISDHTKIETAPPFYGKNASADCAPLDLKGTGRKQSLAVVFTNYNVREYDPAHPEKNDIFLTIYDPHSGDYSEPLKISSYIEDRISQPYLIQSQLQVTCGDYDNDSVDEIAVYVPAESDNQRAKVSVFDLANGKDSADPYNADAWQLCWNYVLPTTSSSSEIVMYMAATSDKYFKNFYNNVDLTSGDADNDGVCDLIISYGASSTGSEVGGGRYDVITRSINSHSVLLYGSDAGQMLKDSQNISYDGNDLIRVSFAFGDLDDDGNEEMILGGQLRSAQNKNESRVLGLYVYDQASDTMVPQLIQNNKVVDDASTDGHFTSANGWDAHYYSTPVMKANITVGKFFGTQSDKRIYLDSVLYSYNGAFSIEDELEDTSVETDAKGNKVPKGCQAMTDIQLENAQVEYYEYGAQSANYVGGDLDYALISRVSKPKENAGDLKMEAVATCLVVSADGDDPDKLKMEGMNTPYFYQAETDGAPFVMASPDTDIDGTVAEYTGNHEIKYDDPKVVAVLASAPYFKDVAAFDNNEMLSSCSTGYGHGTGTERGHEYSTEIEVGICFSAESSGAHIFADTDRGAHFSWEWGDSLSREFTMSYETEAGEDTVVLHSVPREYFEYNVTSVKIDDDGTLTPFTEKMSITYPHRPVTQALALEDYIEIQKEYSDKLPDVTKYYNSKPGDPSSYPTGIDDMPKAASDHIKKDDDGNKMISAADDFAGVSFGGGKVSQSFSVTTTTSKADDNMMTGAFTDLDSGAMGGVPEVFSVKAGVHLEFDSLAGTTKSTTTTDEYSCSVANMPRAAKDYGYDFSWKLFEYNIDYTSAGSAKEKKVNYSFPIVTYIVDDVMSPPSLPDMITQDFDNTTDSQTALTWTYTGMPQEFKIYKYLDFPQGGGDLLAGTVAGNDFRIKKDENGNTVRDKDGNVVHEYTFLDQNLTADTKYQYRLKVTRSKFPQESIFSPVIEARTKVSEMPDVSLTTDKLNIYPDGVYRLSAVVADPEQYEGTINYQWQKYSTAKRTWTDVDGCKNKTIAFFKCSKDDAGTYRCRINLIRKVESHPQYISAYTNTCDVGYAKRTVKFGNIEVFEGTGSSPTNTGVSVTLTNSSAASVEKPTGMVQFRLEGANAAFYVTTRIDEETGIAKVNSLEDGMGTLAQEDFTDGGYKVTASYQGSNIFYAADDPEDYHYLRNITECLWLSARSSYIFGEDIMKTTSLYDYKKNAGGAVTRTDVTSEVKTVKFFAVGTDGKKTGDALATYTLSDTDGKAFLPLNEALANKACVEVFTDDAGDAAGSAVFNTEKMITRLTPANKMTGVGQHLEPYSINDVTLTGDGSLTEKNIVTAGGNKSLEELLLFRYYEANGDFMFDSAHINTDEFIPAEYVVKIEAVDPVKTFYKLKLPSADFTVVGNYYKVKASCSDQNAGVVSMLSPDSKADYDVSGYAGGTKLIFKAVPDRGYQVKRWKINECGENEFFLPASDTITYTVKSRNTSGTGEINITAVLEPKNNALSYDAKGQGTVEVTPQIESGCTVIADTDLTFKATPSDGWKFLEWKFINEGGSNSIAKGIPAEDGTNTKTFTMPDNSATVYGIFMKDTIDLDLQGALDAAYINDGSNPLEEIGDHVATDSGQDVPKGTEVIVTTKKGYGLAAEAQWKVTVTTPEGTFDQKVTELISDGQSGCQFTLPDDATACQVAVQTEKGKFSVDASADDVQFKVKVDGIVQDDSSISGIDAGSNIEITAVPARGKTLKNWIVNGEKIESSELIYTTEITGNLSVSAQTAADTKLSLKLKTEGSGTAKYVITDKNGETHTDTFGGTEITPDLYKGESLTLSAADNETQYTMTAVSVNGKNQIVTDDTFELKDISGNSDIICRFTPSSYCTIGFTDASRSTHPVIMDEDNIPLDAGETIAVPIGSDAIFKIVIPNTGSLHVFSDTSQLLYETRARYDSDHEIYTFRLNTVEKNMVLTVMDYATWEIASWVDLTLFYEEVKKCSGTNCPDAVLTADIDVPANAAFPKSPASYDGIFDGKGHTIRGIHVGSESQYATGDDTYYGLFRTLHGTIKDVILEDYIVYTQNTDNQKQALITQENFGTISGVLLRNAELHTTNNETPESSMAGIAGYNRPDGTITGCKVSGLRLEMQQGQFSTNAPLGCAGVVANIGAMKNNYFENIRTVMPGVYDIDAKFCIVADSDYSTGAFSENYFKTTPNAYDSNGTNVYSMTDDPGTAAFARELAYTINSKSKETIWGVADNNDTVMLQLSLGGESHKAPVRVTFSTDTKNLTLYPYPDDYSLPDAEHFAEDNPVAWAIDDKAFSIGYAPVGFYQDADYTGITQDKLKDYTASLDIEPHGTIYFKNLNDALENATLHNIGNQQQLTILKDCELANKSFTIDDATELTLAGGATLTMKANASIINNGKLVFAEGSTVHKYGTIQNTGSMDIEGTFYNYGSRLTNKGTITNQESIICKPHCTGSWTQAESPNDDNTWTKSSSCEVCGQTVTQTIDPDPAESSVESIYLLTAPSKDVYEIGEPFTDEGLLVAARLTNGDKAVITKYTLTAGDKTIKNGTVLDTEGVQNVTVSYGSFTCGFDIDVINMADLLKITDESGSEITESEMQVGESVQLTAAMNHSLAETYGFLWESSDPQVAAPEDNTLNRTRGILAGKPGKATITVTVVDENENPIPGIDPKSVDITVVHHVTALEILGGDKTLDAGTIYPLKLKVAPADTTDDLIWASTNEDVATVDDHGVVETLRGGKTVITVMSPGGISASCKVTVYEKAGELILDADQIPIALNGFAVLSARIEPATANGEVTWTTDNVSAAGFYVKNSKTGDMDVVDTVTTKLSGDGTEYSDAYVIIAGPAEGQAVITASTEGPDGSILTRSCTVTVDAAAEAVQITHNGSASSGQTLTLDLAGRTIQFGAESTVAGDALTWSVIDDTEAPVIKVNSTGRVTLLRKGTAAVKVKSELTGAVDVCMLKVRVAASEIKLSKESLTMTRKDHLTLSAALLPEGAEDDLIWTSSDETVATVSAAGEITAVGKGSAKIFVTTGNGGVTSSCEVAVKELTHNVTFLNGLGKTLKTLTVIDGKSASAPAAPTRKGYYFNGWDKAFGNVTADMKINATWRKQISIANAKVVLSKTKYTYNKKVQKPAVKTIGNRTLKAGTDYTIKWSNTKPKNVGPYTVTITGKGKYTGMTKATFKINPKGTKIKKLTKGKKSIKVKWTRNKAKMSSSRITGYQIQVATNNKFTKNKKTIKVKGYKKTAKTIKNLKGGKKYYVRVRTYKKVNGVKYYSPWSKVRKIKTKK